MNLENIETLVLRGFASRHHTALTRGYQSRKNPPEVAAYKGKFGEGFAVRTANYASTRYSYVTYYIYL